MTGDLWNWVHNHRKQCFRRKRRLSLRPGSDNLAAATSDLSMTFCNFTRLERPADGWHGSGVVQPYRMRRRRSASASPASTLTKYCQSRSPASSSQHSGHCALALRPPKVHHFHAIINNVAFKTAVLFRFIVAVLERDEDPRGLRVLTKRGFRLIIAPTPPGIAHRGDIEGAISVTSGATSFFRRPPRKRDGSILVESNDPPRSPTERNNHQGRPKPGDSG